MTIAIFPPASAATAITIRQQAELILDGDEDALVELRAVHPRLRQVRQNWFRLHQLDQLERYASTVAPSYDAWLGAAARTRRGGAKEDVAWSAVMWADCDTAAARVALAAFTPAPTLTVRTSTLAEEGERRQAWWKLDRRLGADEIEPVARRLAAALGSDTSVCDRPRVLRALGTINHKRSTPEPIEVVAFTGEVHDTQALLRALPPDPGATARAGAGIQVVPERPLAEGEGRHQHLADFAVRLVRAGVLDEGRVLAHLRLEFELSCEPTPPPQPGGIEQLARWAIRTRIAARERDLPARADGSWWTRSPEEVDGA